MMKNLRKLLINKMMTMTMRIVNLNL